MVENFLTRLASKKVAPVPPAPKDPSKKKKKKPGTGKRGKSKKLSDFLIEQKTQTLDETFEQSTRPQLKPKAVPKRQGGKGFDITISPDKTQATMEEPVPVKKGNVQVTVPEKSKIRQAGQDFHERALKDFEEELTDDWMKDLDENRKSKKNKVIGEGKLK
ncbi:Stm1_N domain-containing protein [Caenorhabditis elegans]|uniref:Stm1_N domain-containing protein n=1 Tax=Caenorhabditis elegans TaxID=6239 RepID=O62357_CAEEL|nr:Stm1_N domain-containing protein [Caenorhabditis elegans]CAB04672.2 Stm1_N domain-containing protein [Caenorhabditis elegans]|eukprot:NP_493002.1 Uncharacterized protein CELE_T02G6.3 [Caenorhabditis elegans]